MEFFYIMLECLVAIQMMAAIDTRPKLVCHSSSCCTAYTVVFTTENIYITLPKEVLKCTMKLHFRLMSLQPWQHLSNFSVYLLEKGYR